MPSQHTVHFFEADELSLLHHLGRYIGDGLEAGEPVVVLTDSRRRERLLSELHRLDTEPDIGKEDGRLVLLDSESILKKLDHAGRIDAERFHAIVGRTMREVVSRSRSRRVRVYGDLVGFLWQQGRYASAVELERNWNALQAQIPFDLFCGYPIDLFGDDFHPSRIDPLICQHTRVMPQYRNAEIQSALDYAMYEAFGRDLRGAESAVKEQIVAGWPDLPSAEATVLWIREHLPAQADEIVGRARQYAAA